MRVHHLCKHSFGVIPLKLEQHRSICALCTRPVTLAPRPDVCVFCERLFKVRTDTLVYAPRSRRLWKTGWAHADCFNHHAGTPRRGAPWSVAEDLHLLRMIRKVPKEHRKGQLYWRRLAQVLGRGSCAVQTRCYGVNAGMAVARVGRRT